MKLTSPSFENNEMIPHKYTCDGQDVNPALDTDDIPNGTKELAIIVDDPDAPGKTWVHWVLFNVPVSNRVKEDSNPGKQGINDFGKLGYGGPCPPSGQHRYYFKLYALDIKIDLAEGIDRMQLESAMEGHILEKTELVGLYSRT